MNTDMVEQVMKHLANNPPDISGDNNIGFAYVQCVGQTIQKLYQVIWMLWILI